MLAQVPCIGFPMDFPSRSALEDRSKLRWVNAEGVQKRIAHWDKQNHAVPAPNCVLKVQGKIIKDKGL